MEQFVKEWIDANPKFINRVKEIEARRGLNLISKLNKEKNEINLDSWVSEMYFGVFFDSIADDLQFEKKIDQKEPDWTVYRAGQIIVAEVLKVNTKEEELLAAKAFEKQIAKHNKENENKIIGYTNGVKILSSEYFYGHQTKVTDKEQKYRELIEQLQLPFIICIDSMEDTFINERDVFDAFLGNYKDGIFFKNKNFCRNVTGLLFRYFLGGAFTYYHNEFAANKLNDSNYEIFKHFDYTNI